MERDNSSKASSRNRVRGWKGLGSIRSMSISRGPATPASRRGAVAVPLATAIGEDGAAGDEGTCSSGSRMSAPSPRPSAFLGIGDNLLGELCIAFRPLTVYVIENNRITETWRLRKAYIAWDDALEDLRPKETSQIGRHLFREYGSLVVHRQENALNF